MWPSIIVPIVIFFGLTVFASSSISGVATKSLHNRK